jgi:ABC-2 type transport system ATP-binding protein
MTQSDEKSSPFPAISVDGLEKTFGSGDQAVTAVDDVSFDIEQGSIVGLLGPNGAGKTTTIKSMLGLILPTTGSVEICGVDVYDEPQRAHRHVGAMLEGERNVYWRLTVRENLEFFAGLGGQRPSKLRERHDRLLERLDLADRADTAVNDLSKGMKQKVSLASTLARDVSVIFLDEPTLGLDVETSQQLHDELRRLAEEENVTIVLTSHNMDVIESVSDRVLIMQNGSIIADDAVENLVDLFETQSYRIVLDGPIEDLVFDQLQTRFDHAARSSDGRVLVECHDAGVSTLHDLLGLIKHSNQSLRTIQSIDPDLEEVFLRLTGEDGDHIVDAVEAAAKATGEDDIADDAVVLEDQDTVEGNADAETKRVSSTIEGGDRDGS